jgi:hypothetical protein
MYEEEESSPDAATESAVSLLNLVGGEKDDYDAGGKGNNQRGKQERRGTAGKS